MLLSEIFNFTADTEIENEFQNVHIIRRLQSNLIVQNGKLTIWNENDIWYYRWIKDEMNHSIYTILMRKYCPRKRLILF